MVRELILSKSNEPAQVVVLGLEHLAQVLALQDETRAALPEAQKMFVLPQPAEYFARMLERRVGMMIGVRVKGQLVAQMAVMGPMTLDDCIQRNAVTRNDVHFHHAEASDLVVIAKSMAVHPDWRGNELSQHMLEAALELPIARTADHVFAQVSAENVRSWDIFLRHGFGIVAAAIDPNDQKARFILQKPAIGFALQDSASVSQLDPQQDFAAIMRLTGREALIGTLNTNSDSGLSFYVERNNAGAWTESEAV